MFLRRDQLEAYSSSEWRLLDFTAPGQALEFLRVYARDPADTQALRQLLMHEPEGYWMSRMTDEQVYAAIARAFANKRLRIAERSVRSAGASPAVEEPARRPELPPAVPAPKRQAAPKPAEENATFPPDLDAAAMAAGARKAAHNGTAVCEVCARAAASQS